MRMAMTLLAALLLVSPAVSPAAASPSAVASLAGRSCELVELYPGYPGYRGYVTGVDGVGDHECLEDLEDEDRSFDRDDEDDANLNAARSLGINGGPELWTWENWLAIEAERGMAPTCFTCLDDLYNDRDEPREHSVDRDDPRLLIGSSFDPDDDFFIARVIISTNNAGEYLNAGELLDAMGRSTQPRVSNDAWCDALSQGGWAPTPKEASSQDQIYLLTVPYYLFSLAQQGNYAAQANENAFIGVVQEWELDWAQGETRSSLARTVERSGLAEEC